MFPQEQFFKIFEEWLTPDTYGSNFSDFPKKAGVYIVVYPGDLKHFGDRNYQILYVGSSGNIRKRLRCRNDLKIIRIVYGYVQVFFKICSNYRALEARLIKELQPRFNIAGR